MKKALFTALLMVLCTNAAPAQEVHRYWVTFTGKAETPYTLDNPSAYLGPRALERRARLHIAVDSLDLPVAPANLNSLRSTGGTVWAVSRWLNGALVYAQSSLYGTDTLQHLPCVKSVEYYGVGSLERSEPFDPYAGERQTAQPCDSLFGPEYYGYGYDNIKSLNGIVLHRAGYDGRGMLVGICDGGFAGVDTLRVFAALRDEGRLVATRDFVYGGDSLFDIHSHGTRVLSNMGADLPGLYVGTAPKASYILCRTEDSGGESPVEEYLWAAAMEYLDSMGVDVVNTSLGYADFDDSTWNHPAESLDGRTAPSSRAAEAASARGILVVLAVGNEGYRPGPNLGVPADSPSALTVGATQRDGGRAMFSSYGPTADGRIKPDVMALGQWVWVVNPDGSLEEVNGTSFASPITAGMAAGVVQRYPHLGPAAWCDSIRAWGNLAGDPDNQCGYGIPDFSLALRGRPPVAIGSPTSNVLPLFPNPATTYVEIPHISGPAHTRIELFDVTGRRIPCRLDGTRLDLTALPGGIYTLRIIGPDTLRTAQLIKQ